MGIEERPAAPRLQTPTNCKHCVDGGVLYHVRLNTDIVGVLKPEGRRKRESFKVKVF
ncbi:MAG: hypothetical protein SWX82_13715 [Cyanobacteriota bacterium]|nr:hypothetical protein [Cyanobacteriota bacterium]